MIKIMCGLVAIACGISVAVLDIGGAFILVTLLAAPLLFAKPVTLVIVCVTCIVGVNTNWLPVPQNLRFVLLGLLLAALLGRWVSERWQHPASDRRMGVWLVVCGAVLALDFARHPSFGTSGQRSAAMVMLLFVAWLVPRTVPFSRAVRLWGALGKVLVVFAIGGVAARAIFQPGGLFVGGALAGGMSNPNAFGIIAGAGLVWVFLDKGVRARPVVLGLLGLLLFLSSSRGALLATAVALVASHPRLSARAAVFGAGAVVLFVLLAPLNIGGAVAGESRWSVWSEAVTKSVDRPMSGVGLGRTEEVIQAGEFTLPTNFQGGQLHNSYVQLVFEIGLLPGLVILVVLGAIMAQVVSTAGALGTANLPRALVVFGLVSALTESWMFSAGSAFAIIFWLAVGSLTASGHARAVSPDTRVPRIEAHL